ncbi:MAG: hypothetical protein Q9221_006905 [Calogaya cf. arnoldii]
MPMPLTARRLERNVKRISYPPNRLRDQRILAALKHENRNDKDMERCLAHPRSAWQVYRERQERLARRTQVWDDDVDRAVRTSDEALRSETCRVKALNMRAEREFVEELRLAGINIDAPKKVARIGNRVEVSHRDTRFGGKVRLFLGERLEGEPLKARPRSKKRKSGKPYPSSASTPPAKRARRTEPSPSSPDTVERKRRSELASPEDMSPAPPASAPVPADTIADAVPLDHQPRKKLRFVVRQPDAATSNNDPAPHTEDPASAIGPELLAQPERLKRIAEALPSSEPPAPLVWNANFNWNQPAGTGLGNADEQRDPNPIYGVKRIKLHVKAPVKE